MIAPAVVDPEGLLALLRSMPDTRVDPPAGPIKVGVLVELDWTTTAAGRRRPPDERRLVAKVLTVDGDSRFPGWTFLRAESSRTGKTYALVIPPAGHRGYEGPKITVRARR